MKKIVILTFESLGSGYLIYHIMNSKYQKYIDQIIISKKSKPLNYVFSYLQKFHLKIFSLKIFEFFSFKIFNLLYLVTKKKIGIPSIKQMCKENNIFFCYENNINSKFNINIFQTKKETVYLSIYFDQIIKEELLQSMGGNCYNIHPSLLPNYGGPIPTFWMLFNKESEAGITLHKIDTNIDEGIIYYQQKFKITPNDSVQSLYLKSTCKATNILYKFLDDILSSQNEIKSIKNEYKKSYYTFPLKDMNINHIKLLSWKYFFLWLKNFKNGSYLDLLPRTCGAAAKPSSSNGDE